MSNNHRKFFDAGTYWRKRVVEDADLSVVGHRSMGVAYNRVIYERRLEVLDETLERYSQKPVEELRIVDIGCGSGFYAEYFAARGIRHYVGIDISAASVSRLKTTFPSYTFVQADVTDPEALSSDTYGNFDLAIVFDVFYHVVDDDRFSVAIKNLAKLLSPAGRVFVIDQLFDHRYQLSPHVVYRDRGAYMREFERSELQLMDSRLLFQYLVPPLFGNRFVDTLVAAAFKVLGLIVRVSDSYSRRLAEFLRRLDARREAEGRRAANSEMFVFFRQSA